VKEHHLAILRRHMVEVIGIHAELSEELIGRAQLDPRVMAAMEEVPRHLFVPEPLRTLAYQDTPLPIGFEKTISQPFIVALMTDLLAVEPSSRVLEVGTGLGYQAAVLSRLVAHVWTIEIIEELAQSAESRLAALGYGNVTIRIGDGTSGWAEYAPFDRILVAAGAEDVPAALLEQLAPGGRMVIPTGPQDRQQLTLILKGPTGTVRPTAIMPVRFGALETVR
jgi:protein-L-isoaspartate(D-aspartate) O-methyltransferase